VPLKFTAGVCKKLGSADRGSLAASCRIEIEFDESFSNDPGGIQLRVEKAYTACRQAVEDELARQQQASGQPAAERPGAAANNPSKSLSKRRNGKRASQKRFDYSE
jgi:hypothetical protein